MPVVIPFTFANASGTVPASELDANFNALASAVNGVSAINPAIGAGPSASMSLAVAGKIATFTADQVAVASALNGTFFMLPSYSQIINLGITGPGGMDTGAAPVSGYVSLYAIYNPALGLTSILACSTATSTTAVYSGGSQPSGYTATAYLGAWPTDGSSNFIIGYQRGRQFVRPSVSVLSGGSGLTYTGASIAAGVPPNAKSFSGFMSYQQNGAGTALVSLASDAGGAGEQQFLQTSLNQSTVLNFNQTIATSQLIYYKTVAAPTTGVAIFATGYTT
jgi:hypothetical protein